MPYSVIFVFMFIMFLMSVYPCHNIKSLTRVRLILMQSVSVWLQIAKSIGTDWDIVYEQYSKFYSPDTQRDTAGAGVAEILE